MFGLTRVIARGCINYELNYKDSKIDVLVSNQSKGKRPNINGHLMPTAQLFSER